MLSALFLSCCLLAQEASASQVTDPGVTLRVFQLAGELSELPKLAPDQTPNRDTLESAIDWSGEDFGDFPAPIYAQALGWLKVTAPTRFSPLEPAPPAVRLDVAPPLRGRSRIV